MPYHDLTAEEQNTLTRARLAAIVRSSADAIVGENMDGIITDWNPAAERLYGYTAAEVIGKHVTTVIPADRLAETDHILAQVRRGQSVEGFETVRWSKDGRRFDISLTVSPVYDDTGQIVATAAIVRDITAIKASERALAAGEARYRALVEQVPAIIYTESRFVTEPMTYVSPYVETFLGFPPQDFLDDPEFWMQRIHPDDRERVGAAAERMHALSAPFAEDYRMLTREGQVVWVHDVASQIRDSSGKFLCWQGMALDVTERNRAQEALAASEERFRVAFEAAPIGMALTAPDYRVLQINRAICEIFGYSEEELRETTLRVHTHPDDIAATQVVVDRALAGEISTFALEKRYIHKDGHVIWAQLSGSLVRDDGGAPRYFISHVQDITERVATAAELEAAHRRTQEILQRVTDGFYALDRDWCFTYVNDAAEQMLGRPRAELIGQTIWEAFPPAVDTPLYGAHHQALAEGVTTTLDFYYPPLAAWFDVRAYPSPDGLSVFFRDITASKAAEAALAQERDLLRTLMDTSPDAIYFKDVSGHFTRVNKAAAAYYGLTDPAAAIGKSDFDFYPEGQAAGFWADERPVLDQGQPLLNRLEYQSGTGAETRWTLATKMPLRDGAQRITGLVGISRDISDLIHAQEELHRSEARFRSLITNATDLITILAADGTVLYESPAITRLLGYGVAELVGRNAFELVHPDDRAALWEIFARAVADPMLTPTAEFRFQHANGTWRWFESRGTNLLADPDVGGFVVNSRDITERKRTDETLRQALEAAQAANRARSQFLAMMSHELRTPMQAVLGYADLLLAGPPESLSAQQVEDVQAIRQGAERMVALVGQILDLSRLDAGRLEFKFEPVDLAKVIDHVRRDVAPQAAASGLTLEVDVAPSLPVVSGDPMRLHQILLNLAGNAVKFTEQGRIRISAAATAESVTVAVSDTGIGIAADVLPHIFEEFRQADSGMTRRYTGAGLGLAIARKLAEQHGGHISVISQPNAGSTFTLHLPIATG
jgi:PAS domain S-box-containing protein